MQRLVTAGRLGGLALAASLSFAMPAAAQDPVSKAMAKLSNAEGKSVGLVVLDEPVRGNGVIVDAMLTNMPEGEHAFHVHETGACDPPDFTSAGGHFNPTGLEHGIRNPEGMHAGDLPNIHVPPSGELRDEMFAVNLSLDDRLFDEDGASIVIHAGGDDYTTDPAGDAGPRIACGVIVPQ